MKTLITCLCLLAFSSPLLAQEGDSGTLVEEGGKRTIYKYKKYERFDLGDFEIKGNIISPGDLSVQERERRVFNRKLFDRFDFDPEIKEDIENFR